MRKITKSQLIQLGVNALKKYPASELTAHDGVSPHIPETSEYYCGWRLFSQLTFFWKVNSVFLCEFKK